MLIIFIIISGIMFITPVADENWSKTFFLTTHSGKLKIIFPTQFN